LNVYIEKRKEIKIMTDYSLSDVASVVKGNDYDNNGFGGGAWWIIVLFLFAFMGNGFYGNRSTNGQPVTEAGLCSAMNFNDLQNAVGRLSDMTKEQTSIISNGICDLGYKMQGDIGDLGRDVALGQAGISQQICKNSGDIKYDMAMGFAAVNKNVDDKFAQMEKYQRDQTIAAQAARINQLELAQQMANVVRYPTSYAYSAGPSPFCGGCCNNI
jgi:hypothetical protein